MERKKEIEKLSKLVDGFSEEFNNKLIKMSDEEFDNWHISFSEDLLTPNLKKK